MHKKKQGKKRPGPKPSALQIPGGWEKAVKKALGKKRPRGGWADTPKKGEDNSTRG